MESWLALVTILFLGDSITAGLYVPPVDRYPQRVGEALGIHAVNWGCPGGTSRDLTEPETQPGACALGGAYPDHIAHNGVVLMIGANDSTGFFETWPNTGEMGWVVNEHEYAGRLLDVIGTSGKPFLLITPTPLGPSFPDEAKALVERYRQVVFRIVETHPNVWLGADGTRLLQHPHDFVDDVHPNEQGLAKLAAAVVKTAQSDPELVLQLLAEQGFDLP